MERWVVVAVMMSGEVVVVMRVNADPNGAVEDVAERLIESGAAANVREVFATPLH